MERGALALGCSAITLVACCVGGLIAYWLFSVGPGAIPPAYVSSPLPPARLVIAPDPSGSGIAPITTDDRPMTMRVVSCDDGHGVRAGDVCSGTLSVDSYVAGAIGCRLAITCGGAPLVPGGVMYLPCELDGSSVYAHDDATSPVDGDPYATVDGVARIVALRDDAGGARGELRFTATLATAP